jgi:LmbE family N-acetylglucosaminyl deacetylase
LFSIIAKELLRMKDNGRVLAVGAHPDDVEFTCAGTLSLLRKKGYRVYVSSMTAGDGGSSVLCAYDIAATRRAEAAKSAALIGAACICLEIGDLCIDVNDAHRRKVTNLIRHVDPFLVICPPLQDYLFDHENTGRLVRDATFCAPVPHYGTCGGEKATAAVPYLYYCAPSSGFDNNGHWMRMPTIIDITAEMETKKEMLACHASQREWLRALHNMDEYTLMAEHWSARTGQDAGFQFAEGFRQHLGPYYPQGNVLLTILGGKAI